MKPCRLPVMDDATLGCLLPAPGEEPGFGSLETARGHFPLEAMDIESGITGLTFRTRLRQTFVNAFDDALEATYIFPLPDRAAVHGFRLEVAGRVVDGVLQERGEARRTYDQAIQQGHRAAIAEEERPGVFTMRAGNIPPGEKVTVELELAGPLPFADGQATFRFPLVVAPRYIPGVALEGPGVGDGVATDTDAVPDASRISPPVLLPGQPNPVALTFAVEIDPAGLPLGEITSSLHQLTREDLDQGRVRVALEPGAERLDRDVILRLAIGDAGIRTGLAVEADPGEGAEATFALTVVPPTLADSGTTPRDVVVVLDRSGSMQGWKMVAARRAAGRLVDTLTAHDRFSVLLFDNRVEVLSPAEGVDGLVAASDRHRFRAVEQLAKAEARGGTEMSRALNTAVRHLAHGEAGREKVIVFVTDGQVGNEDQLLWQVRKQAKGIRVFAVGVDRAVNEAFLRRLAQPTGGAYELVESEDRLDEIMKSLYRRIGKPVLTDLVLEGGGVELVEQESAPRGATDVFPGVPAVLYGRMKGLPREKLTLKGTLANGDAWTREVDAREVLEEAAALSRSWARARLLDLEHEYVTAGRSPELSARMTALSLRHGVLCRFTAFVAVDRKEVVNEGGEGHRVTQPVESPDGWDMGAPDGGTGAPMPMPCAPAPAMGGGMAFSAAMAPAGAPPPPAPQGRRKMKRSRTAAGGLARSLADMATGALESLGGMMGGGGGGEESTERLSMFADTMDDCLMDLEECEAAPAPPPEPLATREIRRLADQLWRGVVDDGVREVREAGDDAEVAAAVAYLVTDLEEVLARFEGQSGLDEVAAKVKEILEALRALGEADLTRGNAALGAALEKLIDLDAELFRKAAPSGSADGGEEEGRRDREFWR